MNLNFINLNVFDLTCCSRDHPFGCPRYHHRNRYIDKHVSVHSVRLDQIVDVDHGSSIINFDESNAVTGGAPEPLRYYTVKTASPDAGSATLAISADSYERLCEVLRIDGVIPVSEIPGPSGV